MMATRMGEIIIFTAALLALVVAAAFYFYHKPHRNIGESKPDYRIEARQLAISYSENEKNADSTYLGKVLQVRGRMLNAENIPSADAVIVKGAGMTDSVANFYQERKFQKKALKFQLLLKAYALAC